MRAGWVTTARRMGVLTTVMMAMLVAVPATAAAAPTAPYYVALGDSRATTATWSALLRDGCGSDADAYPALVAAQLHVSSVSRACSGATTANVINTPHLTVYGFRPPQVRAVGKQTRLVTLSIGGNDIQWWQLISGCFTANFGKDAKCRDDAKTATRIQTALTALGPRLDATLRAIAARGPSARIVVVGHGGYYGAKGCAGQANISDADALYVLKFFARFNAVIKTAADAANATYVDVAGPAKGHDTCAPSTRRWFEGNAAVGENQSRHATALGRRAIARLVLTALR